MYTTINESGIVNNYVTEPQLYYAEYPNQEQQNRYKSQGTTLVLVALGVS
jgi:hypothetical protein